MTHTTAGAEQRPSVLPKPPTFQDNKVYLVARLGGDIGPYLADTPEDRMSARIMGWNIVAAHARRPRPRCCAPAASSRCPSPCSMC